MFVLGVVVRGGWVTVDESTGRCGLGTLLLHDEPGGDGSDQTEGGETSHNTSGNGTSVGSSSSSSRVSRDARWRKGATPGARVARK